MREKMGSTQAAAAQRGPRNEAVQAPGGVGTGTPLKGSDAPLVSAIVSTYDAERFLRGKLEDLEAQTIADRLEIIVIDAASPGNERAIVEEFQRRYDNIRYLRTEKRETVYQAWNRGIRMATGEFVTNANTDDRIRADAYEILVRTLREHPECVLAYPDMLITRQENNTFETHERYGFRDWPDFDRLGLLELCCVGPFPLWRRSLHEEIGYFDERFKSAADYEFWLRAALTHDFIHVPEFLGLYWLSPDTVSRKGELPTLEYLLVQKEYRPRYAPLTPPPVALPPEQQASFDRLASRVQGGDQAALREVEDILKRHPHAAQPHHELAVILHRLGDIGLAKTHFEKAVLLDPASERYRDGLLAFQAKELAEPLRYYQEQAGAAPGNLENQLCAGAILTLLGRCDEARTYYLRAKAIAPDSPLAAGHLAFLDGPQTAGSAGTAAETPSRRSSKAAPERVLVSAIVSTYNSEKFLRGCLEDLEAQTIAHRMEIIVVDSASPQNEAAIVEEFQRRYDNIRYIRTPERETIYRAWNRGIAAATGLYLTSANTDDRHRCDAFELMSATLEALPDIALVYADQLYTEHPNDTFEGTASRKQRAWSRYEGVQTIRSHCMVSSQPMWRRSLHERYGLFDDNFASAGDWEFWLRIAQGERFLKIDQVLGLYFANPEGVENSHPASEAEAARVREKYGIRPEEQRYPVFVEYTPGPVRSRRPGPNPTPPAPRPLISVVIPCFNYGRYLEEAVASVARQECRDVEIIIVNDGSTDDTDTVARRLIRTFPERRITLVSQENSGQPAISRNNGIARAQGEYIVCLDADDTLAPGYLSACVGALQNAPGVSIAYGDQQDFGASDLFEPHPEYSAQNLLCFNFIPPAAMFRRKAWTDTGGYRPSRTHRSSYEDWAFWISCLSKGHRGKKVAGAVWNYRIHEGGHYQKSQQHDQQLKAEIVLETTECYSPLQRKWALGVLDGLPEACALGTGIGIIPSHEELLRSGFAPEPAPLPATVPRLRILFTMYGWEESGGGTSYPRSVAKELARRGHEVSVFYASLTSSPALPPYALEKRCEDGVRLYGVCNRPALFTDPDHPEREIRDEGVLGRLREVLKETAPQVVHFHNFHGLTLAMAQLVRELGIHSCFTPHNYHMIDPELYLFDRNLCLWNGTDPLRNAAAVRRNPEKKELYRERILVTRKVMNEWVDLVLAVSTRQKELLVEYGADPARVAVVHQASPSCDRLWRNGELARQARRPLHEPLRIGFIGGVTHNKGVHMIIAAAQHFSRDEVEFHVFGSVASDLLTWLRSLDRAGMVAFHGGYCEEDLPGIAAELDLALVPSVTEDCAPLVLLELMAMRLPVIAARIGGIPDFVREGVNGFLYRYDEVAELVQAVRSCLGNRQLVARMRGSMTAPHSFARYLEHVEGLYMALAAGTPPAADQRELRVDIRGATTDVGAKPAVVWEGSQFVGHSLALVNRELCLQLIGDGYPLSIIPYEEDQFGAEADPRFHLLAEAVRRPLAAAPAVHVRHQWPPDFTPPPQGRWVMIQPWEFGSLPVRWVEAMNGMVDEVWVPSSYVRDCYLRSGVRPERVFTVPNGVNTALFNPQAPPITLKTQKRFKFLFVGGTIARKGIDILLQAYSAAFTSGDDVCLVIKDMGGGSFYQGRTAQELIARYRQNPDLPEVEYLDRFLPDRELAGLYTACDCLVHPYRGEGFGLPMAEAMACGLAVVVTGHGAALDFCSAETAYLIPAREVKLPMKKVGELETVDHPWLAEPDAAALADIMRHVAEHPGEARERGRAAARHIARNFTWEKAAACVRARLAALSEETEPRHEATPARREEGLLCSIVIKTAGALGELERCLDGIARHTQERHEVLLIHHGAQEGERLEKLARRYAECRLVEGGARLADADPYHAGIVQARGDVLVLMEPDVVTTPGWLAGMLDCLDREAGAGIVGPMGDCATGLQRARGPETTDGAALEEFARSFAARHARRRMPARMLDPFCMLLTRTALKATGGPDARLRRGDRGEDLCLRAALAGFSCMVAGDVFLHRLPSRESEHDPETGKLSFREKWALAGLEPELAKRVASRQALFLAQQLARQGSLDAAVDLFLQQGIALAPTEPAPYLLLAEALLDAGSFKNALEVLEQVPTGAELQRLYLDWRCRSALGQEKEALARIEAIAQLAPETPLALYLQGKAAAGRGDAAGAEALFRRSCQADPGFAPPWLELARLHRERGEYGEALDLAEKSFILAPLDLPGLALFHDLAEELSELPREEERVREACLLYPEHKGLCFGLVEVLIRQGHYLQALEELERAAVSYGLDDAALDAALEIRKLAGPAFPDSPCRAAVSVCMIVKDERRHLPAALASVKPFASEIVVVDTGSTDRSVDLARLFGARVFAFPWNGDFSEARNLSLSQATGEWILVLDADEVLAARDLPRLQELVSRAGSAAFSITTRNYTAEVTRKNWTANAGEYPAEERGLGWTPSLKVRLFPNAPRVRFQGAVHELVEGTLAQCGIPVLPCDIPVHHYGKLDNAKCAEKQEQYYLLGMKKLSQGGATVEALTELAIQATELGRFSEAEELWRRVLELTPEAAEPYFNLGYLYLSLGDYRKAREHALKGARLAPEMKEAAFNLAKAELFLGDTERASAGCRDMLLKWPEYPPALSLLCVCRLLAGETEEAEAIVRRLTQLGYDCADFLDEYAAGLARGERGELAAPVKELAQRLERRSSAQ